MITQGILVHRIEEELFYDKSYYRSSDPYVTSLDLEAFCHSLGNVHEKINKLISSSTGRVDSRIAFTIEKILDKNSKLIVLVNLSGEVKQKELEVEITSIFHSKIGPSFGHMEQTYNEYYNKKIVPHAKSILERESKMIIEKIVRKIKNLAEIEK
jgi:hypothetical protein